MTQPLDSPLLPQTPMDCLGELVTDTVLVEGREFFISHPRSADRLLDVPEVRSAFAIDEYMPYWADLWPGSRMLGKDLIRHPWPAGTLALEVGCGLGLAGVVALAQGLRVIFSDYDATALRFAADNARANGFSDFTTLQMDWRFPPDDLRVPLILAADLIYEMRNVPPLLALMKKLLTPDGVCLLTDQDRPPCHYFRECLTDGGFDWTMETARAGEPGGRRYKGTLYRIRLPRPASAEDDR